MIKNLITELSVSATVFILIRDKQKQPTPCFAKVLEIMLFPEIAIIEILRVALPKELIAASNLNMIGISVHNQGLGTSNIFHFCQKVQLVFLLFPKLSYEFFEISRTGMI